MKGLLYKDFSVLTNSYKRNALLVVVLYAAIVTATQQAYLAYVLTVMGGLYASSTVSFDEQARWDAYARTLPLTPRQIVGAKYLLCLVATAVMGLMSAAMLLVLLPLAATLTGDAAEIPTVAETMVSILTCAGVSMLMSAVVLPFSYKYGGAKARSYMGVTFGVVFFLMIFALNSMSETQSRMIDAVLESLNGAAIAGISVLLVAVVIAVSYAACVKIYEKNAR